jgi:NAD(P)H-quinone oxidoreductase subunit 4L
MTIHQLFLLTAAALFSVGLFGALSQQSIVMLMMGLELMVNGVILAAVTFWHFQEPSTSDGQIPVLIAFCVMAIEMAMGFAVQISLFRARDADMTDMVGDLRG